MAQILIHKQNRFGHWQFEFGAYLGFGYWNLGY